MTGVGYVSLKTNTDNHAGGFKMAEKQKPDSQLPWNDKPKT